MKIDKNYPGLKEKYGYYILDSDLISEDDLIISIPLLVNGEIKAGGCIKAWEWIEAGGWIKAREWIEAGGWIKAGGWIEAGGWIYIFKIKTKNLYFINGTFAFNILVMDTHLRIGCQLKTKKEWLDVTEDQAKKLGDDGSMWKHREFIWRLCK